MMIFLLSLTFLPFAAKRLLRYMHIFQQEEYDARRFVTWLCVSHTYDKKASIGVLLATFFNVFIPSLAFVSVFAVCLWLLYLAWSEENPLKAAKKPLMLTERARRSLWVAAGVEIIVILCTPLMFFPAWILVIQAIPLTLIAASFLLKPFEMAVKAKFRTEAVDKLQKINPYIIGITGSYGKTSVKHILGHVLEFHGPTLFTPGSVNTEMGIVRIIREQLSPQHTYFIVEMGAYGIGSIERLCRLTPPKLSIITAIGQAHYERFKTLDDTTRAKFEIAEAALAQQGHIILHDSVLEQPFAQSFCDAHKENVITVGATGQAKIMSSTQTADGLLIILKWNGVEYTISTPLYGLHHSGNVALAFTAAADLGMNPAHIVIALKSAPQISHRLEVKRFSDHILIDDAYNSNPKGFSSALDLLHLLGANTRRILVTPGMVELGTDHDSAHHSLGVKAAACADIVMAVCPERIRSFIDGFHTQKKDGQILLEMASFKDAQNWLVANKQQGDVILLENDLPDLYERQFSA